MRAMGLVRPPAGEGIMRVVSPGQLQKYEKEKAEAERGQNAPIIGSLAAHLNRLWSNARFAKLEHENRMLAALRQRNGVYDPAKLAAIREQGGSEIYMMLTNIKCRAAESWISDVMFQPGDKPWGIEPTPIPDLPGHIEQAIKEEVFAASQIVEQIRGPVSPEDIRERIEGMRDEFLKQIKEMARDRAQRMSVKIEDQLVEAEWEKATREFIKDVVTFPAGIIKGPVIRKTRSLTWRRRNGRWLPVIEPSLKLRFYRVSPFDIYPSANSTGINDGYLFERHRLRRSDLTAMMGVPGYSDPAIRLVLDEYGRGGLRQWLTNDQERATLEGRPNEWQGRDETIDALEFSGSVQGRMLLEWGMNKEDVPDPMAEYEVNAWLIGNYVIRAIINPDPLGRRPYHKSSFEEIPGSFWGYGVPELMSDVQDVVNATSRALVNNLALASGPQVEVHTDRMAAGEDIHALGPWRIWQTVNDPNGHNNPAVRFYQPDSNASVLLKVFEYYSKLADEYTGIPAYTYGNSQNVQGAGRTASGLSMLMTAASRGIKQVISHIDVAVEGCIRLTYEHNMLYDKDESIKGDCKIKARGSASLIAKEQQQIRRTEFLAATNNPIDLSIIGQAGRAKLLRDAVTSMDIDADEVVPEEAIEAMKAAAMAEMGTPAGQPMPQSTSLDPAGDPAGGNANLFQGGA